MRDLLYKKMKAPPKSSSSKKPKSSKTKSSKKAKSTSTPTSEEDGAHTWGASDGFKVDMPSEEEILKMVSEARETQTQIEHNEL